jgi:hypothetical protein
VRHLLRVLTQQLNNQKVISQWLEEQNI